MMSMTKMFFLFLCLNCAVASDPGENQQPVYLRVTVSNGVQQEIHYIQLEDEEDLEAYHADEWDYETEINLQLDYSGRDMLGDHEEITYEVYQQHQHIAHGHAEIRDVNDEAPAENQQPPVENQNLPDANQDPPAATTFTHAGDVWWRPTGFSFITGTRVDVNKERPTIFSPLSDRFILDTRANRDSVLSHFLHTRRNGWVVSVYDGGRLLHRSPTLTGNEAQGLYDHYRSGGGDRAIQFPIGARVELSAGQPSRIHQIGTIRPERTEAPAENQDQNAPAEIQ
jgi:hypothetical protein